MKRKIGLYILSLWLLFFFIIIITADVPICFNSDWEFIGIGNLLKRNIIPSVCVFALIIGGFSFYDFNHATQGSSELSVNISTIENIEYEHLSFLTTYIVPLICFSFDNTRYVLVLLMLLIIIGMIYIRTDLFYANPTLALLGFRIYKVSITLRTEETKNNIILITRDQLKENNRIQYIKIDDRIYYAHKK